MKRSKQTKKIKLAGKHEIAFDYDSQLIFHNGETLPEHPNGMRIFASDKNGIVVYYKSYLSVGGGFIVCADEFTKQQNNSNKAPKALALLLFLIVSRMPRN